MGLGDLSSQKTHPDTTNGLPAFSEPPDSFQLSISLLVTALETIPGTTDV